MENRTFTTSYQYFESKADLEKEDLELMEQAIKAHENAYAPYSQFHVGCALLLENGKVILGNNQENAAYPSGMCAERVAIWKASSDFPGVKVLKLAIAVRSNNQVVDKPVGPCGSCRQTLSEYEINQKQGIEVFFMGEKGPVIKTDSLLELLPLAFDKSYL